MGGLVITSNGVTLEKEFEDRIIKTIDYVANAKEVEKSMREELKLAMEFNNVKSIETDNLRITYINGSSTLQFDKDAFSCENPELYEKYKTKRSDRKSTVSFKKK